MQYLAALVVLSVACDFHTVPDGADAPAQQQRASIYSLVDATQLRARLGEIASTERWSPAAKASFRAYWTQYMSALGATVSELAFPIADLVGEAQGHDVEAVLPGRSADSVVIVTHYDSDGITGLETLNPGADDAGSGLAVQMEAARIFARLAERDYTVRFVITDYEELTDNLAGAVAYIANLGAEATAGGFRIVVASNSDMVGWSCWSDGLCGSNPPASRSTFQIISCSGDRASYDYPELANGLSAVAARYSTTMTPSNLCDGSGATDHYAFWQAGIPAYAILEYAVDNNPHADAGGDDTLAHIDFDMLAEIARIQIAYQAELAGIR